MPINLHSRLHHDQQTAHAALESAAAAYSNYPMSGELTLNIFMQYLNLREGKTIRPGELINNHETAN